MANCWYAYLGPSTPTVQYNFPSNYSKESSPSGCFCVGCDPCAIYAPCVSGLIPGSFSTQLKSYIATGVATCTCQPAVAGAKKFFYVIDE